MILSNTLINFLHSHSSDEHRDSLNEEVAATILSRQAAIDRIKRCCCSYVEVRKQKLKALRWKYYGTPPEEVRKNLSPEELEWIKNYSRMASEYQLGFGQNGLNLMLHTNPPRNLQVQVKVLKDYGECETSDGTVINLKKNAFVSGFSYIVYLSKWFPAYITLSRLSRLNQTRGSRRSGICFLD